MDYVFLGLSKSLVKHISKYPADIVSGLNEVEISFNIDGLPLFKSSRTNVWPVQYVLCGLMLTPATVFPVALTSGHSKPQDLTFNELSDILQNGLPYEGRILAVKLRCFVCDAPARAMIRATKQYSGYFGCDKCDQKGVWHGRITYPDIDVTLRTDRSFRLQEQEEHHLGISPLINLPVTVDCVAVVPIDYMHQACLGVMRRLLNLWIKLKGNRETKLSAGQIEQLSGRLLALQRDTPNCFARKPRGFKDLERWKATEYRLFMLYYGKFVLKGLLNNEFYMHFMSFSVAMCILVSPGLVRLYKDFAHSLLVYFISKGITLYGIEFAVYNVHSMLHIAKDAHSFSGLDNC